MWPLRPQLRMPVIQRALCAGSRSLAALQPPPDHLTLRPHLVVVPPASRRPLSRLGSTQAACNAGPAACSPWPATLQQLQCGPWGRGSAAPAWGVRGAPCRRPQRLALAAVDLRPTPLPASTRGSPGRPPAASSSGGAPLRSSWCHQATRHQRRRGRAYTSATCRHSSGARSKSKLFTRAHRVFGCKCQGAGRK